MESKNDMHTDPEIETTAEELAETRTEPAVREKKRLRFDKQKFKNGFRTRAFRAGGYSTIAAVAVVAIAFVVMLVVNRIPSRLTQLDISANKIYTLGDQSGQIAASLTDDVTIYVIVQTGNEDVTLSALLDQYDGASEHISVETVDPVVSPNFLNQYTSDSVYENSLVVVCGERSRYIGYDDIFETDYTSYYTTGTTTTSFNGESEITSAIDYVTSEELPLAYQLQGHGELGLGSSAESAIAGENIELETLSLLTEDGVPDDCECLIIASPQTDISSDEKDAILAYLADGGTMLLVTDYLEDETPNLDALMEYYGVTKVDGIVVEGDGDYSLRGYNHYLLPEINYHTITSPLQDGSYYVLMPIAQGLVVSSELRDTLDVTELLTTTSDAFSKLAGYDMTTYEQESGDIEGPFALGVAITDETDDEEAQIVWLTTTMMFDDDVDAMVSGANTDLLLNSLGWMCERENTISIRAKTLDAEQLVVSSGDAARWSVILIGVLPLALILGGVVVVVGRKRK